MRSGTLSATAIAIPPTTTVNGPLHLNDSRAAFDECPSAAKGRSPPGARSYSASRSSCFAFGSGAYRAVKTGHRTCSAISSVILGSDS